MRSVGFEHAITAIKRPQNYGLDRRATSHFTIYILYYKQWQTFNVVLATFDSILTWNVFPMYEGWNLNSGNYLFTTDTK